MDNNSVDFGYDDFDFDDLEPDVRGFFEDLGYTENDEIREFFVLICRILEYDSFEELAMHISDELDEEGLGEVDSSEYLDEIRRISEL